MEHYTALVIGQLLIHLRGFIDIYIQVLSANFFPTLDVKINVYRQTLELKWLLLAWVHHRHASLTATAPRDRGQDKQNQIIRY